MIERRRHRRIITLRHFGLVVVIALVALAAMNVISELRAPRGNVYGRVETVKQVPVPVPHVQVVREGGADAPVRPRDEVALVPLDGGEGAAAPQSIAPQGTAPPRAAAPQHASN